MVEVTCSVGRMASTWAGVSLRKLGPEGEWEDYGERRVMRLTL